MGVSHEIHIFFPQTPPCISHLLNMNLLENGQVRFVGRLLIIGYDASYWNRAQARQMFEDCPTCQTLLFFARVARMKIWSPTPCIRVRATLHCSRLTIKSHYSLCGNDWMSEENALAWSGALKCRISKRVTGTSVWGDWNIGWGETRHNSQVAQSTGVEDVWQRQW